MYNHQDDAAFERIVNLPTRGLGAKSIDKIRMLARDNGSTLWQASQQLIQTSQLPARACSSLAGFLQLIETALEDLHELPLSEQIQLIIETSQLDSMYAKEKGEKALARKENLAELANAAREFDADDYPDLSPMTAFLAHASLEAGDTQAEQYQDCVQLMTLHSAKGLEFPLVFIAGMEEKLFPHMMSMDEPEKLEEERRLAYVGITRAMQQLYLIYCEKRRLYGKETYPAVSRFIKEIPNELKQDIRLNNQVIQPVFSTQQSQASDPTSDQQFSLGQMVEHPTYGCGVILNCEGSDNQARVQVNFDSVGCKWLMLAYAKLTAA